MKHLDWLEKTAKEELPGTVQIDFKGESREYLQSGQAILFTFAVGLAGGVSGTGRAV